MDLRDAVLRYFPQLSPTGRRDYQLQVDNLTRYLRQDGTLGADEAARLEHLTHLHIAGAMHWQLGRGRSNATANKLRRTLLAILNEARRQRLDVEPPEMVKKLKEHRHPPTAWTVDQFARLLEAAATLDNPRMRVPAESTFFQALLLLLYNSGLRMNTAMQAEWRWLDWPGKLLHVPPHAQKHDEGATICLLDHTVDALRPLHTGEHGRLFGHWPFDPQGRPWKTLRNHLRVCLFRAGLIESPDDDTAARKGFHMIRRTFATHVARSSSVETASRLLGHSSVSITLRYYVDLTQLGRPSERDLLPPIKPQRLRVVS